MRIRRWVTACLLACTCALPLLAASADSADPASHSTPPPIAPISYQDFGSMHIGTASNVVPVTVTFNTAETLGKIAVLTQGTPNLDFVDAGGDTCVAGQTYAVNATCIVNIEFKPRFTGPRNGAVVLHDTNGVTLGMGYLHGTGMGGQVTFLPGSFSVLDQGFVYVAGVAVDGETLSTRRS